MRRMLTAAVLVAAAATTIGADDDPAIERLTALGEAMRSQPVLSSEYVQVNLPAGMSLGDEVRGRVWVSWPDRALFVWGDPEVGQMGLDGRRTRVLDRETGTCDDHHLTEEEWQQVPLAAVLEPAAAMDRFVVIARDHGGFDLIPRESGGVDRIEVELDGESFPTRLVITNPQGGTNTFEFGGWKVADAPRQGWLPDPPRGVECQTIEVK